MAHWLFIRARILIHELYKIHQTDVGCASSISQEAAMTALTVDRDNPSEIVPIFRERRDYVLKRLDEIGISYIKPGGHFMSLQILKSLA